MQPYYYANEIFDDDIVYCSKDFSMGMDHFYDCNRNLLTNMDTNSDIQSIDENSNFSENNSITQVLYINASLKPINLNLLSYLIYRKELNSHSDSHSDSQ